MNIKNMSIAQLQQHFKNNDFNPEQLIDDILERAEQLKHYNTWIYLLSKDEIQPYLENLAKKSADELPLYGIPFAIKDNIDLAGVPTTAACAEFSYLPEKSSMVVEKLIQAGAVPIGKTNLDQFATGLVGTRSPYGACKNSLNEQWISGGSSSGSAVAVAQGLVSFSLGTDTAGSGRVPAAFNNIIGLKPSRGLLSNQGVVPACQSLDCVAIFTAVADDLEILLKTAAGHDPEDCFSKKHALKTPVDKSSFVFAVPNQDQLAFFGNDYFQQQFENAIEQMQRIGGIKKTIDFQPFMSAAKLLYEGPWVTERYLAAQTLIDSNPKSLLEVIHQIIAPGKHKLASEVFSSLYKLQTCKQLTDDILEQVDFLMTPTTGTMYHIDEVNADPIALNSNLGYYTNFMNLLDYSAIALPFSLSDKKLPFGITLVSRASEDRQLIAFARQWQQSLCLSLGAMPWQSSDLIPAEVSVQSDRINLVVCGAHMSGLALNYQLLEREAVFVKSCLSAPKYKLYVVAGKDLQRPGMVRQEDFSTAIEVEVWSMPLSHFGSFLATIPHPLGLGKVELDDGSWETGFICEAYIKKDSVDISQLGGWRAYLEQKN